MLGLTKNLSTGAVRASLRARQAGMCHGNRHGMLSNRLCHRGRLHHFQCVFSNITLPDPFCAARPERVVVFMDGEISAP